MGGEGVGGDDRGGCNDGRSLCVCVCVCVCMYVNNILITVGLHKHTYYSSA